MYVSEIKCKWNKMKNKRICNMKINDNTIMKASIMNKVSTK